MQIIFVCVRNFLRLGIFKVFYLYSRRRLLRPQFEGTFKEPFRFGSWTSRIICHHPNPVVGIGLETNDKSMGICGSTEQILRFSDLIEILPPVLDPMANKFSTDFFTFLRDGGPSNVQGCGVKRSCTHLKENRN